MQKKSSSESGSFNPRVAIASVLCAASALMMGMLAIAAVPSSGTLSPATPLLEWEGSGPYVIPSAVGNEVCETGEQCDDYALTIDLPADYATTTPNAKIRIEVSWGTPEADFDVFILNAAGEDISDSAAATGANPEVYEFAAKPGQQTYTVRVKPFLPLGSNFSGKVSLITGPAGEEAPTEPAPPVFQGIAPRYQTYQPGPGLGETAAEPTMGWNPHTKRAMYISGLQTLRVTFPENGSCDALWEDVSYVLTSIKSLDPILFTDPETGRTFVSQLNSQVPPAGPVLIGMNSFMAYTDDDGENWTPAQINPPDGSYDHQNVGGGPYPEPLRTIRSTNPLLYKNAVYYCSQAGVTAFCSRSDDGGLNFNPSRPIYNLVTDGCGGIHGHVKVAPDGTVYVPVRGCNGVQSVTVSEDAGETWTVRQVKSDTFFAKPPKGIIDPSLGIGADGTIYFAYVSGEIDGGRIRVAVSRDKGVTWTDDQNIGFYQGLKNNVFPTAIAGDGDRAAVAFLGTTEPGDHESAEFRGTWYAFISHTYDGGKTWVTVNATPNAPVQREAGIWNQGGSNPLRNLLDFTGITKDSNGRVMYSFADGCIGECESKGPNSFTEKATIARQSGGKTLFAAFDPVEPALPTGACLSGRRDDLASYLKWRMPDTGGSDILDFQIYRSTTAPGSEVLVGTASGNKTSFTDRSTNPAVPKYFYRIFARNAVGAGAASNVVELVVGPRDEPTGACALPGVQVVTDPAGDANTNQPFHDVTSASIAEPEDFAGKIVFTLKMANLSTIPPGFRWAVRFRAPQPPTVGLPAGFIADDYFVAMTTSEGAGPSFTYGVTAIPENPAVPGRYFVKSGDLDPASNASPDGTITFVLPKEAIGSPGPGAVINNILASVRVTPPSDLPGSGGTNETIPDSSDSPGVYVLRTAELCLPNTAPLALLTSNIDSGVQPLTVEFSGAGSTDPDAIDTIAGYTFNFGDGTDDVVQTSPTITHTFNEPGLYAVKLVVTDSRGKQSNTSQRLIEITPSGAPSAAQLLNISTRLRVQPGDNALFGGFIVSGSDPKKVIVRATGPSLKAGGAPLEGRLLDPTLDLYDGSGALIASNDNWKDSAERAEIESSGAAPSDDSEPAIVRTLSAGLYTAIVRGNGDTSGIGVVEAYDLAPKTNSQLANVSSRGVVETGDNVMIGGFITGNRFGNTKVAVRAIGPSLSAQLPNALQDPALGVYDQNGQAIAVNDNWRDRQTEVQATGIPPSDDREAAIFTSVPPGQYTAIVRGVNNTTGVGVVEVYNIP